MTPAPFRPAGQPRLGAGRGRPSYHPAVQAGLVRYRGDLLVVGYAALAQVETHLWHPSAPLPLRLVLLAGVLALLGRHRAPRATPLLCAAGGVVAGVWLDGAGSGTGIVTAGIAAALLGRQGRRAVPALVALMAIVVTGSLLDPMQASDLVTAPVLLLAVAGVSAGLFRASRQVDEVRARIDELVAMRDGDHAAVLSDERRRVARELHDIVSHHLTVAAVQAGGARMHLEAAGGTAAVVTALGTAEQAGREALGDLRSLLDVVGGDRTLAPQPGMADVARLVQQVRATGVEVWLSGGDAVPSQLPAGHDLAAFRVVQEALTNAVRHGRSAVDVRLAVQGEQLHIEVSNDAERVTAAGPGGHGLVGMRERLALYGGRLDVARRGSRWTLHAELPLPSAEGVRT